MVITKEDYEVHINPDGLKWVKILNANAKISELSLKIGVEEFPGVPEENLQVEVSDDGHIVLVAVN